MAKTIRWTNAAAEDLRAISDFISRDSIRYADQVIERIIEAIERAAEFPGMGRRVPEYPRRDLREVIVYQYRAVYQVRGAQIIVIGIIHGARLLRKAMRGRA